MELWSLMISLIHANGIIYLYNEGLQLKMVWNSMCSMRKERRGAGSPLLWQWPMLLQPALWERRERMKCFRFNVRLMANCIAKLISVKSYIYIYFYIIWNHVRHSDETNIKQKLWISNWKAIGVYVFHVFGSSISSIIQPGKRIYTTKG